MSSLMKDKAGRQSCYNYKPQKANYRTLQETRNMDTLFSATLAGNYASINNYLLPDSTSSTVVVKSPARFSPKNPFLSSPWFSTCESIGHALSGFTVASVCALARDSSS